jgi:hypothetical protein
MWALQPWGPHFYTILGFGVDLFFGLVIFLVFTSGRWFLVLTDATTFVSFFFASFSFGSSLPM